MVSSYRNEPIVYRSLILMVMSHHDKESFTRPTEIAAEECSSNVICGTMLQNQKPAQLLDLLSAESYRVSRDIDIALTELLYHAIFKSISYK